MSNKKMKYFKNSVKPVVMKKDDNDYFTNDNDDWDDDDDYNDYTYDFCD